MINQVYDEMVLLDDRHNVPGTNTVVAACHVAKFLTRLEIGNLAWIHHVDGGIFCFARVSDTKPYTIGSGDAACLAVRFALCTDNVTTYIPIHAIFPCLRDKTHILGSLPTPSGYKCNKRWCNISKSLLKDYASLFENINVCNPMDPMDPMDLDLDLDLDLDDTFSIYDSPFSDISTMDDTSSIYDDFTTPTLFMDDDDLYNFALV